MNERSLQEIAQGAFKAIDELIEALKIANASNDEKREEEARQAIEEHPLDIQIRQDWHTLNADKSGISHEFVILLSTGGPATRIIGRLDEHMQPYDSRLEAQGWYQPWEKFHATAEEEKTIQRFAECFYFGD